VGTGLNWIRMESDNELTGPLKVGNFFESLSDYEVSRRTLHHMKLMPCCDVSSLLQRFVLSSCVSS
jgi:hypothetical protein